MWNLNSLTHPQIIGVLRILNVMEAQIEAYRNPVSVYRPYIPFLENEELRRKFYDFYMEQIAKIPRDQYLGKNCLRHW